MSELDPTADYRKYDKGPNFKAIVFGFLLTVLVVLAMAVFFLKMRGTKVVPHGPNPTPNALVESPRRRTTWV